MQPPFSYVPLLPLLVALVTGAAVSRGCEDDIWLLVTVLLCLALCALMLGRRYVSTLIIAVAAGAAVYDVDSISYRASMPVEGIHRACGRVIAVNEGSMSRRLLVTLKDNYCGDCYLTVPDFSPEIKPGDNIEFTANFSDLHGRKDIDGDIDLADFYFRNHIAGRAIVLHDSLRVTGIDDSILWRIRRQRDNFVDKITCSGLSQDSQAFVSALLFGDDSLMDKDMRPEFAGAGLAHILALSGMHVAIIAGILSWIMLPLAWLGHRKVRWILVIMILWLYAVMTGMSPSVTRAVIMFTLVLMAKCMGRFYSSANALCFAAIAIILFEPRQLYAPGFQLSFMAVFALVTIPAVLPEISTGNRAMRWIVKYIVYTLSAVTGTVLLAIYYFHQMPVYFLFANIPCAFVLPLILGGGLLIVVLQCFGIDCSVLDYVVDKLCGVVINVAGRLSNLPASTVECLYPEWWGVFAGYVAIDSVIAYIYYRKKLFITFASVGILLFAISFNTVDSDDEVLFIGRDADATNVIFTSNGRAFIISSVPEPNQNEMATLAMRRYADFMGYHRIDTIHIVDSKRAQSNRIMSFGDKRIALINCNEIPERGNRVDYLIVCRGFKGNIMELTETVDCDSILLGTDINGIRRQRYQRELESIGRPVRSLAGDYGLVLRSE